MKFNLTTVFEMMLERAARTLPDRDLSSVRPEVRIIRDPDTGKFECEATVEFWFDPDSARYHDRLRIAPENILAVSNE